MFKKFLPQIIAMLFLAGFVAYAWTGPSGSPPNNNVDAPINVGSIAQIKAGDLSVGGLFRVFSDVIVDGLLNVGGGKLVVTIEGATNSTAGPNNPTSVINEGAVNWTNPANAAASDNNYALTSGAGAGCDGNINLSCSNFLKATGFNFSLPANAIIDGIQAEIERRGANIPAYNLPQDHGIKIVKGGVIQGNDKSSSGFWPTADTYQSYGGPNDKWGLTLIAGDINSSDFGVAISVALNGDPDDGWGEAYVDHIRIKVYYHTGGMDVVKVSSVTIAGDGSVSTNLNADKLDDLHASEISRNALFGRVMINFHNSCNGGQAYCQPWSCTSGSSPAFCQVTGSFNGCTTYGPGCPAGYTAVLIKDWTLPCPYYGSFQVIYSCQKQ